MKVLLSALHFGFLRNFESVVGGLADRGHHVVLAADEEEDLGGQPLAAALSARADGRVRWCYTPSYESESWFGVARKLRQGTDYLRFLDARYDDFPKLRERIAERIPRALGATLALPGTRTGAGRRVLQGLLDRVEREMPTNPAVDRWLLEERPDVVLLASVTNPRGPQLDHLRSARRLGIPTVVCVYSWDHLSSKSLIRVVPDRVFVWNDVQRREATELHLLPADRIVVTGAQCYDQWFGRTSTRDRPRLLADFGLPPDRVLLLYVCSAMTPDPRESQFVRQWLETIRGSGCAPLAGAAVVIRPHPERRAEWNGIDWSDLGPLHIGGRNPLTADAKADYFDALAHSSAVVGLVTSAFLEAAIVGAPVLTVLPDELRSHQEGMQHFRYLLEVEDGLLETARTLEHHRAQLEATVVDREHHRVRQERFLRAFVRPFGLDQPATPRFIEAVEAAAHAGTAPEIRHSSPLWGAVCRTLVRSASVDGAVQRWMFDAREWRNYQQRAAEEARRAEKAAARDERVLAKDAARQAERLEKDRQRDEKVRRKQQRQRRNRLRKSRARLVAVGTRLKSAFGSRSSS